MKRKQEILWGLAGGKGAGAFRGRASSRQSADGRRSFWRPLPGASSVGRTPHPPSRDGELFSPVLRRLGEAYAHSRHQPLSARYTPSLLGRVSRLVEVGWGLNPRVEFAKPLNDGGLDPPPSV